MSFDDPKVWLNGQVVDRQDAAVGIGSHALHYGTGVFEGIRCYETAEGPAVFRLDAHLDRLFASAAVYRMVIPFSREELARGVRQVLRANGLLSGYIRPLVFLGDESLGVNASPSVNVAILAWAWSAPRGAEAAMKGVRITVSPWQKISGTMIPSTAKACGQYVGSRLAVQEAASRGYDEALLLNPDGTIAEGAVENFFLIKDGVLRTNDEKSNILLGITRASILDLARDAGIPVAISTLRLPDLFSADETFFTGTAVEVLPIREVDGANLGGGGRGPVTARLQDAFADTVRGRNPARKAWLSPVGNG